MEENEEHLPETLQPSVERFRILAAAGFDGIGISQDGKVIEVNDQLAQLLGCERSELIGMDVMSFVAPESRERVTSAMRSGSGEAYEHLALRKDGSTLAVEVRGKIIRLGGRDARVTVVRDVSQRRRVEDAVRSIVDSTSVVGVEFFSALVRGVARALGVRYAFVGEFTQPWPAASGVHDRRLRTLALWADGRLIANSEFPVGGTPCENLVADGLCFYPQGVRKQFPQDGVLEALGADAFLGVPLFAVSGRPLGVLVAMHDRRIDQSELAKAVFTIFASRAAAEMERLQADAALRQSEASLRATIDGAPHVAIQWYDAEGRVLLWNHASEQIFGWLKEEAVGKTLDQLMLTAEGGRGFVDRIAAILHSSQPSEPGQYRFRRRDGSEGHCLSTTFRISDENGHPRVACMDVDITERRRAEMQKRDLEAQLQHTQQLESLGAFAGGIAHDFNNILTAIFAYSELASASADEPDQVREYLAELHTASIRARDLVQQILVFSRRQTQAYVPVRLQLILQEAVKFLRSTLPSTIEIQPSIDGNVPPVLASPIQMYQVILNLCMNAAHAMQGEPGKLEIVLDSAQVGSAPGDHQQLASGDYVRLRVSDTGHGMDAGTLKRIFEPFFTTKLDGQGTGLGLAVVRSIVVEHRGSVQVASEVGRGTRFEIYLPARSEEELMKVDRRSSRPQGNGERVMLVDDELTLCEAARAVLQRMGYRVFAYTDPLLALAAFEQAPHDFDVVVTDLTMPNMKGTELARRLLALRRELPVVLVSGFTGGLAPGELESLGVRDFIPKPFKPSDLATAIRRTLDRRGDLDAGRSPNGLAASAAAKFC